MKHYSTLPNLIESLGDHVPDSELENISLSVDECLEHQASLSNFINTIACYCDFGEIENAGYMLAQVNIALSETNSVLIDLKNSAQSRAKLANRAKITTTPLSKVQGGAK